jgi:alpha-L-fucosidase
LLAALTFGGILPGAILAQADQDRTLWMKDARWGVMTHYLQPWIARGEKIEIGPDKWNELVDHFDVEGLAEQIKSTGAGYHILTIGQGSSYFLTPSPAYARLIGGGTDNSAKRDLVADLSAALSKRGVKLIVYSTCGGPRDGRPAPPPPAAQGRDRRNKERMLAWQEVIREWSLRWGDKVAGWWFDGCYTPNSLFRFDDPPNFESFAAAARAGNPNAVIAFNPGVVDRVISFTQFEDYTAGEIEDLSRTLIRRAVEGRVDGERIHKLSYLGTTWGFAPPRYTNLDEMVIPWTKKVVQAGGAMTWDAPIQPNGLISEPFMEQLRAIGKAVKDTSN